jgi:2'-5' RNA ligase
MKAVKLFEEFILEKEGDTYDYGCAMLYFDFPQIKDIHAKIAEADLYTEEGDRTFGIEDEPHCTLLYGLHKEVTPEMIQEIVKNFKFEACEAHNASLFENEYDVLKFDIKGTNLHECNEALAKLPHTNSFPDYHPHMTIAYIKKGLGEKYTKMLEDSAFDLEPTRIIYSTPEGDKITMPINR